MHSLLGLQILLCLQQIYPFQTYPTNLYPLISYPKLH